MQKVSIANIDLFLFNLINGYAKKSRLLDFFAVFCASYLGFFLFGFLVLYAFFTEHWEIFWVPFASALFARFFINQLIYLFYKRKRPLEVLHINSLVRKPRHPSFPSGHTAFFFGLSFAIFPYSLSVAILFSILSFMVGFFRIFSGVHWPSDILGGIAVGYISFLVVYLIFF